MLWRIPADTHVWIGTLLNSFSSSTTPDRPADNESMLPDSDLMAILRKEENAASNYQWSALSQTRRSSSAAAMGSRQVLGVDGVANISGQQVGACAIA